MKKTIFTPRNAAFSSLGDRLKEVRGRISRDKFAAKLGISRNTLQRYEIEGGDPGAQLLALLCEKFGCDANWLLFGQSDNSPPQTAQTSTAINDQLLLEAFTTMEGLVETSKYTFTPDARAELAHKIYLNLCQDCGLDLIQLMSDLKDTTNKLA